MTNKQSVEEGQYIMPSIEKDGYHWIRMVDHFALLNIQQQKFEQMIDDLELICGGACDRDSFQFGVSEVKDRLKWKLQALSQDSEEEEVE